MLETQRSDAELVCAAACGDADSFTVLCQRYYPAMVAIAHAIIGDRHLAEDAAQQGFAKAAVKLPQLRNEKSFASWLATICRNTAKDLTKTIDKTDLNEDLSEIAAPQDTDELADAVKEAVCKLPDSDREVVFLKFYDGLSYEQISAVLEITEYAINGRIRRAKKKIAAYLKGNGFVEVQL